MITSVKGVLGLVLTFVTLSVPSAVSAAPGGVPKEVADLQAAVATIQSEVLSLQRVVSGLQSTNTMLQNRVTTLQAAVSSLEASGSTLQSHVATLNTNSISVNSLVSSLQASNSTLQSQVVMLDSKVIALGRVRTVVVTRVASGYQAARVDCLEGERLTGGGGLAPPFVPNQGVLVVSAPLDRTGFVYGFPEEPATSWYVLSAHREDFVTAFAMCESEVR